GIAVGLVTLIGGIAALVAHFHGGSSAVDRYRTSLRTEVCLGDLAAAADSSDWSSLAANDPEGHIDKGSWLTAMDTVRLHLVSARDRLTQLTPTASLRADWEGARAGLNQYIQFWEDFKGHTQGLGAGDLTVFTYPGAEWQGRLNEANTAVSASLGRLLGQ